MNFVFLASTKDCPNETSSPAPPPPPFALEGNCRWRRGGRRAQGGTRVAGWTGGGGQRAVGEDQEGRIRDVHPGCPVFDSVHTDVQSLSAVGQSRQKTRRMGVQLVVGT